MNHCFYDLVIAQSHIAILFLFRLIVQLYIKVGSSFSFTQSFDMANITITIAHTWLGNYISTGKSISNID